MRIFQKSLGAVVVLTASLSVGCHRGAGESPVSGSGGTFGAVGDDLRGAAKQTEKAAKDVGRATVDLADKAGQHLEHLTDKAGAEGQDAWITTKVKSALTASGLDPLHVHVDTSEKVVTLSGTVPSAAERDRAVTAARTVTQVLDVKDHLFVKADGR